MKLSTVYDPGEHEDKIYKLWEKSGVFKPSGKGKGYSIVMPPPNANGDLHLGHGLTIAVEDIAIRYHRMKGYDALYVPGADHAGFETQVVYERLLEKEGKSRFDFSRDELYQQIWDFVAKNRNNFENQIRKLGASVDWEHFTFTLDDKVVERAYETFKKMWNEGLIYRGERLVNFCTFHGTAFADIEVEYKEEKGHLWYLRYPLTDGTGNITVATTRPETMLGDTAVAVNPDDKRYKSLLGKTVKLPITNREVPIIADSFVDKKFGTGAVKVTPAHDPNDFEIGERHSLPRITVIDFEGKMTNVPEIYRGLDVKEARSKIIEDLDNQGFLVKTQDHNHSVGHCYKCGTVIQSLLRDQWFIDVKDLAKNAIDAIGAGKIEFHPENKKKQLITYLENLKDWNISRQIAWGIPIPAFQNVEDSDDWIYDEQVDEEIIKVGNKTYHRDPDVFDTWFSSSSWPYATLDYPNSDDFKKFYPLSVMETGADILYPWVSRMIMFGLYITDEVPFESVYLHGLINDEQGQKMSKSKGNVIGPMQKVEQFGSDAFRMGIISDESAGQNRPYDESKLVGARNFCNKLWNIARYIEGVLGNDFIPGPPKTDGIADHWILNKLKRYQDDIGKDLDNYRFSLAYERLYHFIWNELADWYIEASKTNPNKQLLAYLLEQVLTLTHPFAPFITETIWQTLGWEKDSMLVSRSIENILPSDKKLATDFDDIKDIIGEIRHITKTLDVSGVSLYHDNISFLEDNSELIKHLAKLKQVKNAKHQNGIQLTSSKYPCWLDIDPKKYADDLRSKKSEKEAQIKQLDTRLANTSYVQNAPKKVVDETKQQLDEAKAQLKVISQELDRLK